MVDEPLAPVIPEAAPAVEVVTPAPAIETPAATAAETPVVAEVAPVEPVKTEVPAAEPVKVEAPAEDVLGAEKPKEGEKKAEGEKAKAPTESKPEAPIELPIYEEFKLPDGVKLDKEPMDAFAKILGKIETGKLDHAGIQAAGQELVDLATKGTIDSINRLNDSYVQIHKDNVSKRVTALKSDPVMGGENFQSTVSMLQDSVAEFGGTQEQIADFRKEISEAGLGPSPAVCRLIYNMQKKIDTYTKEGDESRIVPGQKPAPMKVKPYQLFYQGG